MVPATYIMDYAYPLGCTYTYQRTYHPVYSSLAHNNHPVEHTNCTLGIGS